MKKATPAPRSVKIERANLAHLVPELGRKLICDIDAQAIARYQKKRLHEDASPKTINLEIGTLRAILKRAGQWAQLQPEVKMLFTRGDGGRAITPEEESALLQACSQSRSRSPVPFVTLAIETGARYGVIRTLQWGSVDFENRRLRWGKDKTASGTGRIVPLSQGRLLRSASGLRTSPSASPTIACLTVSLSQWTLWHRSRRRSDRQSWSGG